MNPEEREPAEVIKLVGDRKVLEDKVVEYNARLSNPELDHVKQRDARYKIAVMQELLENGELDVLALAQKMIREDGTIDINLFNNAKDVAQLYMQQSHQGK